MMQEFLAVILNYISQEDDGVTDEQICHIINEKYYKLSDVEQQQSVKILLSCVDDDYVGIYLLSFLLYAVKDGRIIEQIQDILTIWLRNESHLLEAISVYRQLQMFVFQNNIENQFDELSFYFRQREIFTLISKKVCENLSSELNKVAYDDRNKDSIVLLIDPLLNEYHAPTAKMVNLIDYLNKCGYQTRVCATNHEEIELLASELWYSGNVSISFYNASGQFLENILGVEIEGYHMQYCVNSFYNQIDDLLAYVQDINPAFIISVGGENIFSSVCNEITTVVEMGCTDELPITNSRYIARYFRYDEQIHKLKYENRMRENQIILEVPFSKELLTVEEEVTRSDFNLSEDEFLLGIVGNRLDEEIGEPFLSMIYGILEEHTNVGVVVIGKCDVLKYRVESGSYGNRFHFLGYMKNFRSSMGLFDLFVNPPRQGGGGGAYYALENKVPVVTLPACDVAGDAGKAFVCDNLEEMQNIISKYINDSNFMNIQKMNCEERMAYWSSNDNVQTVKLFCEKLQELIKND